MLPEVEFWCSPPELGLEVGERPGHITTTTDQCVMDLDQGHNATQCSRYQGAASTRVFIFTLVTCQI